jgi:hypothetical protein
LLGNANTADLVTSFENTTDSEASLLGTHAAAGIGAQGTSATGIGVFGGSGDITGSPPLPETGVLGYATTSVDSTGVVG